jgi:hypothetical protein
MERTRIIRDAVEEVLRRFRTPGGVVVVVVVASYTFVVELSSIIARPWVDERRAGATAEPSIARPWVDERRAGATAEPSIANSQSASVGRRILV